MVSVDQPGLDAAVRRFGLNLVVLFGSHAKGKPAPDPDSDIDVAVRGCPADRFLDCYEALASVIRGGELDLVRLEEADPLLRHEIMQQGVLLAGDPDLFCEYRAFAYKDFIDSADLFALEEALYRKKMTLLRERLHGSS